MSKKRKLGNRADDYMEEKVETFGTTEYKDEVFDAMVEAEQIPITSTEVPIMSIFADPLQPRRIIPGEIRDVWDGDPARMPAILQAWAEMLYDSGNDIPIDKILKGEEEPAQYMTGEKYVDSFIKLLEIASSIRAIGLNQPIGIRPIPGDNFRIIFGERRWTAFHLLDHFLPAEDFSTIPVKIADVTEWQIRAMQIGENNQREDTNAISKAREFALLLITARSDTDQYDPPHTLVAPDCDRPYYAQVANGEVHRIPRGMGPQFEQILSISTGQMRKYRSLLKLTEDHRVNNVIWNLADDNDWAEKFMYEIQSHLSVDEIVEVLSEFDLYRSRANGIDIKSVSSEVASQVEESFREAIESAKNAAELAKKQKQRDEKPYLNRWVELGGGWVGRVTDQNGNRLTLEDMDGNINIANVPLIVDKDVTPRSNRPAESDLPDPATVGTGSIPSENDDDDAHVGTGFSPSAEDDQTPEQPEEDDTPTGIKMEGHGFKHGDRVATRSGIKGTVSHIEGIYVIIDRDDRSPTHRSYHYDNLFHLEPEHDDDTGSDKSNSLSHSEQQIQELIGKTVIYQGEQCLVLHPKKGMPDHVVIQRGKEQKNVHYTSLKLEQPPTDETEDDDPADDTPPADIITSIDSLPGKSDRFLKGPDAAFLQMVILDCATEGIAHNHIVDLHRIQTHQMDALAAKDELPTVLLKAKEQVRNYADHINRKYDALIGDITKHYHGGSDGD